MQNNQLFSAILTPKIVRYTIVIFIAIVGVWLTVSYFMQSDNFHLTPVGIPSSNKSPQIIDDHIYAFNGLFFYKQSLTEHTPATVLSEGIKLPAITKALWVKDKGVVLNFDGSLTRTIVEDEARSIGLSFSEKRSSTWYYDFSTNTIHYVGNFLIDGNSGYFDGKDRLYYLQRDESSLTLHTYVIPTKKDTSVPLSQNIKDVQLIDRCPTSQEVCITGTLSEKPGHSGMYAVGKQGEVKTLFSIEGDVYPLTGGEWVLSLNRSDDLSSKEDGNIPQYKKATLTNLKTSNKIDINHTFSSGNFLFTLYDDDRFVSLVDGGDNYITSGTRIGLRQLSKNTTYTQTGQPFSEGYTTNLSSSRDAILLNTIDKGYSVFAKDNYVRNNFSTLKQSEALKVADQCAGNTEKYNALNKENDNITIYLNDDKDFNNKVKSISKCLIEEDLIRGYNLSFTSIDPKSGRSTSY